MPWLLAFLTFALAPTDSLVADESKPVRRAIEQWYDRNKAAFAAKDVAAIMSLRTPDAHAVTFDGEISTFSDMEARTRRLLESIDHFVTLDFDIGAIEVEGELATAEVRQRTVRIQRVPYDDALHEVDASCVQRETWKRTSQGWKLYRVDRMRDGELLVDGRSWPPTTHAN